MKVKKHLDKLPDTASTQAGRAKAWYELVDRYGGTAEAGIQLIQQLRYYTVLWNDQTKALEKKTDELELVTATKNQLWEQVQAAEARSRSLEAQYDKLSAQWSDLSRQHDQLQLDHGRLRRDSALHRGFAAAYRARLARAWNFADWMKGFKVEP